MIFALITFFAAFSIEGIGTLVSVIGLSSLFGSNPIIIALAIALDIGKLVVVTLLYKYWSKLGVIMKSYGLIAACVTMIITSAGAAGYLSGEFQKAMVGTQESGLKVDVLKAQIAKYEERKKQIDDQIAKLPEKTTVNQRLRLMNGFKAEQAELQAKISEIDKQLPALQIQQISVEAKAGPILFIAKAFDIPVEQAVKWVILMIIFVFDPLAVFLIIAGNFLWEQRKPKPEVDLFADEPDRGNPSVIPPDRFEEERLERRIKAAEEVMREGPPVRPFPTLRELALPPTDVPPITKADMDAQMVPEAPAPAPTQDPTPPIFEVLQPTPVSPEVVPEPAPTVLFNSPDTSETKVYTRQDLIDAGVSDEMLIEAGYEPREPEPEPVREVITREQLVPSTHFPAVSSLNAVKADDTVVFEDNPQAHSKAFFQNLK